MLRELLGESGRLCVVEIGTATSGPIGSAEAPDCSVLARDLVKGRLLAATGRSVVAGRSPEGDSSGVESVIADLLIMRVNCCVACPGPGGDAGTLRTEEEDEPCSGGRLDTIGGVGSF